MKSNEVKLHGEVLVMRVCGIPKTAKAKEVKGKTYKLADSESTGNHHLLEVPKGGKFFEEGDRVYLNSPNSFKVRCVHQDRHDTMEFDAGTYEFGISEEYDPFEARMRKSRD